MNPNHNPMADFKPVFYEIKDQIKRYAAYRVALKKVAKLSPGPTMEARVAARAEAKADVTKVYGPWPRIGIARLLTAHRHLRGKVANHGFKPEEAPLVTEFVVKLIRDQLAKKVELVS